MVPCEKDNEGEKHEELVQDINFSTVKHNLKIHLWNCSRIKIKKRNLSLIYFFLSNFHSFYKFFSLRNKNKIYTKNQLPRRILIINLRSIKFTTETRSISQRVMK